MTQHLFERRCTAYFLRHHTSRRPRVKRRKYPHRDGPHQRRPRGAHREGHGWLREDTHLHDS